VPIVGHELVSSKVTMMDRGWLVEEGPLARILGGARIEWARAFVDKILRR